MEPQMREPLLKKHPEARAVTMHELVGVAHAMAHQAVRRYEQLARLMERRGAPDTAAAFRRLAGEERKQVEAVVQLAARLGEAVPPPEPFEPRLPSEIAESWDEIATSALLTPYRAYALAVRTEEQAFILYTYLAIEAQSEAVMGEAERLARDALHRASRLRQWRRKAYHRNGDHLHELRPALTSVSELQEFLARREAAIASCHSDLAAKLRAVGDEESAAMLDALSDGAVPVVAPPSGDEAIGSSKSDPVHLLIAAQKPLERLSEELECLVASDDAAISALAVAAMTTVLAQLTSISRQVGRRSREP
jgi:rubrerythrin